MSSSGSSYRDTAGTAVIYGLHEITASSSSRLFSFKNSEDDKTGSCKLNPLVDGVKIASYAPNDGVNVPDFMNTASGSGMALVCCDHDKGATT